MSGGPRPSRTEAVGRRPGWAAGPRLKANDGGGGGGGEEGTNGDRLTPFWKEEARTATASGRGEINK